jgi:hypothetical protein
MIPNQEPPSWPLAFLLRTRQIERKRKMKHRIGKIVVAAIFVAATSVHANPKTRSKSIVIVTPSDLPEIAQRTSEAMYIRDTGGGRTLLYLEQDQGRTLAILDVSDPGAIRAVAQVSIAARSPYDFVEPLRDSAALIHYRDDSGFAVINFKKVKKPVLADEPQFQHPADAAPLGHDGLLLASATHPPAQADDPQYQVFDVSNPSNPTTLATVKGVRQRLERTETGTLFLLTNTGLTVIRRPSVERQYKLESTYTN